VLKDGHKQHRTSEKEVKAFHLVGRQRPSIHAPTTSIDVTSPHILYYERHLLTKDGEKNTVVRDRAEQPEDAPRRDVRRIPAAGILAAAVARSKGGRRHDVARVPRPRHGAGVLPRPVGGRHDVDAPDDPATKRQSLSQQGEASGERQEPAACLQEGGGGGI